jgi:hypothetical protein
MRSLSDHLYILSLCLLGAITLKPLNAEAQRQDQSSKLLVGLTVSPELVSQLGVLPGIHGPAWGRFNYTAGVDVLYRFHTYWGIHGGIRYVQMGDLAENLFANTTPLGVRFAEEDAFLTANLVEVPVRMRGYLFTSPYVGLYGTIGVAPGYLIGSRLRTSGLATSGELESPKPATGFALNVLAGFGAEARINYRWSATVCPEFRYYVLQPYELPDNRRPLMYAVGIQAGLYYSIR